MTSQSWGERVVAEFIYDPYHDWLNWAGNTGRYWLLWYLYVECAIHPTQLSWPG